MRNCLQKKSAQLLIKRSPHRLLVSLFVFMMFLTGAQATTYYWVGGASGNWSDPTNWSTSTDITSLTPQAAGSAVPGADSTDVVNFLSAATITLSNNIQVAQILIPNPNLATSDFTVTLTGSSIEATTKIETVRAAGTGAGDNAKSTLKFECDVTSPLLIMHTGANITIDSTSTASIASIQNQGTAELPSVLTVSGTLTSNSITLKNDSALKLIINSGATVSAGTLTGKDGSVTNNGLLITQNSIGENLINTSSSSGTNTVTGAAGAFVWTGASDDDWTNDANWFGGVAPTAADTTAVVNIPAVSRMPVIPTSLTFSADNLHIDSGANITVNGSLTLEGTTSTLDLAKINTSSSGTVSFEGTLTNSAVYDASNLTINSGALTNSANLKCKKLSVTGASVISGTSTIESTGSGTAGGITFGGAVTQTDSLTLKSSEAVSFGADSSLENLTITAGTSVSTTKNLTVEGNWTNNGTFTAGTPSKVIFTTDDTNEAYTAISGNNTFYDLEIQRNININSDTTVHDFIANRKKSAATTNMGKRNIIFANNKKLTVQGSLNLEGNSNTGGQRLRLAGGTDPDHLTTPWELECTNASASHSIQYVSFKGCTNSSASPLVLTNCTDMGGNDGYVFLGQAYEWKGGASGHTTDWAWAANWTPASIPGKASVIKIPKGKTYYPVIKSTDSIDIDNGDTEATTANYGTITIEAGSDTQAAGKLDLAAYNIKAKKITNNGILRLTGAAGQVFKRTDGTTATVMVNGAASTVEYYSTGTNPTNFVWDGDATTAGKQYANLILSQATASAATTEITCSASLTINAAATLHGKLSVTGKTILAASSGNDVILDNDANIFTGNITLGLADSDPAVAFNAGAVTIKSAGTITIDDNANAQSFDCYCEVKAQNITSSGSQIYRADLTLLGNATFTTSSSSIDFQTDIKGSGYTLTLDSNAQTSNATSADIIPAIVTKAGKSFTPSAGTTTFNGDVTFEDGTVNASSGTVILKSDSVFNGSNVFKNLTIIGPGKTIQFADTSEQTVNGNLVLTGGTGDGNKLNLTSTGTWKINCANPTTLEYLSVTNSNNTTTDGVVFIASNSTDNGGNSNWAFPGMPYNWNGGDSAGEYDWKNAKNWSPASIPGKGSVITIQKGKTYYPVIKSTDNIDIDDGLSTTATATHGTITIEAGTDTEAAGQLDLAEYSIKSKKITNNGILQLKGALTQNLTRADGSTTVMENGTASTVEYHGSGNLDKFVWDGGTAAGKQYVNLKISLALPSTSTAASEQLVVSGTTTLNAGTGNDVILSNTGNRFSGSIIAGSTESPAFIAGAVSLKSSTSVTIADKANADSLNIECPDLTLIRIQNVTSSGDQIYNGNVQISGDATLKAPASKDIKFNGTVTGATSSSLTIADPSGASTAATTYFTGNVSNLVSLSTKNVEINSTSDISITTSGTQLYDGTISLAVPQLSITASATTFKGNVSETSSSALSVTGPLTIDSACASITTTGSQTYAGAVTVATTTSINTTNAEVNFTSATANVSGSGSLTISSGTGPITFACTTGTSTNPLNELVISSGTTGTLSFNKGGCLGNSFSYTAGLINLTKTLTVTGSFETGNLIVTGNTTIQTSGNQIYNGTVSGGANLTLNSHYQSGTGTITFNGDVNGTTPLAKLQTIGDVTINCENVVTSGTQTYNNAVTLGTGSPDSRKLNGSSLTFNSTINGAKKLELTATETTFKGVIGGTTPPVSLSITGATTIDSGCTAITTAEEQTYSGTVTTQEDSLFTANSKTITFAGDLTLTGGDLELSATGTDGGITFEAESKVTGSKTLTLVAGTNNVAFNGHAGTSTSTTARLNELVITSAGSTTFENKVFISNFSDDPAHQGNITFKKGGHISSIGTGPDGTIYTNGTVTIGQTGATATLTNVSNFTHTAGETIINGTLKGSEITLGETSGSQITIINNELFKTDDGKALSFTTSFIQEGAGKNMLGGSFSGTGTASFDTDVYLYGTGSATADFGTAGNNITIAADANLIISRDSTGALSINADSVSADNIVFYKGSVNLNGNLYSQKDIVILGGTSYSTEDSSTGFTNEYAYDATRPSDWSTALYTFESQFPDTTAISRGNTSFSVDSGKIIHAGKNFYANGTTLSGSSEWFIDILSNADSSVCFAEAYNSTISNCTVRLHDGTTAAGSSTPDSAQIPAEDCTLTGCTNFDNTDFTITDTWTTRDNVVYVKFNRAVRNLNGELNGAVANFKYHNSADNDTSYASISVNEDGSTPLEDGSEIAEIYLLAANGKPWNTDATGTNAVNTNSTDRTGVSKTAIPYIDIPRALSTQNALITDRFGKRLIHYSGAGSRITTVLDKAGPVLVKVRTGQETHDTTLTAQKAYDAHNFIEFIYSEAVNFGPSANATDASKMNTADWIPAYQSGVSGTANTPENIQVSLSLGYVNNMSGLTFTGLNQTIASGEIHTRQAGSDSQDVNALYRQSTHSIKYSLAGYASNVNTAGSITGSYVIWPGYIESAATPSGLVTCSATAASPNMNVTDCAVQADGTTPQYNPQIMNNPSLTVDSSEAAGTNYGVWDTLSPVFVRGHIRGDTDEAPYYEAIGNGNGSTLTKIEIHIADNPSSATSPNGIWLTRYGWSSSSATTGTLHSAAADSLIGGSRPYTTSTSNQTTGGLRYCTILGQQAKFSYAIGEGASSTTTDFTAIAPGAEAPFFTSSTSDYHNIPTTQDNTYISLTLDHTDLLYNQTFTVSYNDSGSYITDLAGNRLHSQPLMNTIDRTSPDFKISFSPINSNKLLLIFVKGLSTQIKYNMLNIPESFEDIIPYCFEIGTISGSAFSANSGTGNLQIDTSTPARILRDKSNAHYTAIELTLNQNTTLDDIKNLYIRLKNAGTVNIIPGSSHTYAPTTTDPLTGIPGSYVTFIQDSIGNYMQMYQAHALSDFASGIVNPLYAYNDNLEYDSENITQNLYQDDSWAVHDWNAEQKNYGTLQANKPVTVISSVDDTNLTADASGDPQFTLKLYYSASPTSGSQSNSFNSDIPNNPLRLWMPEISDFADDGLFPAYASTTNSNYGVITGSLVKEHDMSEGFEFKFTNSDVQSFASGKQVSFLFGIFDTAGTTQESICINPTISSFTGGTATYTTSNKVPLLCIRLKNPGDITSLDLWSFKTKSIASQRGGVTILNNVINAKHGEKTVIKVDLPEAGRLNVIVMTLDGNIITYLNRGSTKAGEHYFTWNGKNKNGASVARGMYFIRVTGSGIDETRKVMVVKDD